MKNFIFFLFRPSPPSRWIQINTFPILHPIPSPSPSRIYGKSTFVLNSAAMRYDEWRRRTRKKTKKWETFFSAIDWCSYQKASRLRFCMCRTVVNDLWLFIRWKNKSGPVNIAHGLQSWALTPPQLNQQLFISFFHLLGLARMSSKNEMNKCLGCCCSLSTRKKFSILFFAVFYSHTSQRCSRRRFLPYLTSPARDFLPFINSIHCDVDIFRCYQWEIFLRVYFLLHQFLPHCIYTSKQIKIASSSSRVDSPTSHPHCVEPLRQQQARKAPRSFLI